MRQKLHGYMNGTMRGLNGPALALNGIADHVHVLFRLPATSDLSSYMRELKSNASRWVHENYPDRADFAWQEGYAAFSMSESQVPVVRAYIDNQEAHHRKSSFKEELIALLKKHGLSYDERFLFD